LAANEEGTPSIKESAGQPHRYPKQSGDLVSQGLAGVLKAAPLALNPLHEEGVWMQAPIEGLTEKHGSARETNGATDKSIYKSVQIASGLTDDRSEATLLNTFHPVMRNRRTGIPMVAHSPGREP